MYRIRHITSDDVPTILKNYRGATGRGLTRELWDWLYVTNPFSQNTHPLAMAETRDGEFAGCMLTMPWGVVRNGVEYYVTIGSNAYVPEDHRRRGVYSLIVDYVLTNYRSVLGDIRLIFYNNKTRNASVGTQDGFEDSVSLRFINTSRLTNYLSSQGLTKALGAHIYSFYSRFKGNNKLSGVELEPTCVEEMAEYYMKWAQNEERFHTARTEKYLKWRLSEPGIKFMPYKVRVRGVEKGYITTSFLDAFGDYPFKTLVLDDFLFEGDSSEIFQGAVGEAIKQYPTAEVALTRAFTNPAFEKALTNLGFLNSNELPLSTWIKPGFVGIRVYNKSVGSILSRDNWYLTYSDCF